MTASTKTFYRIREVSALLGVPTSTLRYWETEFPMLRPRRTDSGQRRYTNDDINLCEHIRELLYDRKMKIDAARELMLATYRKYAPRNPFVCNTADDALKLLAEAKSFVPDQHGKKRIEAVEEWIKNRAD